MGRTRLERAIAKLKKEIEQCENYKKRVLNHVKILKKNYVSGKITYYEYRQLIQKGLEGKTLTHALLK